MQTNPEQWAVDFAHKLWPMAQVGPSEGIEDAALRIASAIQAAFAEREARLVGALEGLLNMPGDIDTTCNPPEVQQLILAARLKAWAEARATLAALKDRTDG